MNHYNSKQNRNKNKKGSKLQIKMLKNTFYLIFDYTIYFYVLFKFFFFNHFNEAACINWSHFLRKYKQKTIQKKTKQNLTGNKWYSWFKKLIYSWLEIEFKAEKLKIFVNELLVLFFFFYIFCQQITKFFFALPC